MGARWHMVVGAGALGFGALGALVGCALLTDLKGLSCGADLCPDSGTVGDTSDGGTRDATTTQDGDVAITSDATTDQDGGRTCPSGRGPTMIDTGSFCIDSSEVTQKQYAEFLAAIKASPNPPVQPPECTANTSFTPTAAACPEYNPTTLAEYPMPCVDWCDARAYCAWAGKRLCGAINGGGRIEVDAATSPTLSEWMFACTRGGQRAFAYGTSSDVSACPADGGGPHPIETAVKCQGGFDGIFDMNGNLEEWDNSCSVISGALNCHQRGGDSYASSPSSCAGVSLDLIDDARRDNGIRCCAD